MFERKHHQLASRPVFIRRLVLFIGIAFLLIAAALCLGVAGYHWTAGYGWTDSLLNASMILGGMGQITPLTTVGAKIFASFYALFSGVVFIAVMGIVFSPIVHRMLHKFHVDDRDLK